jgi:PIN domain nuclease of toxin-antitoxin system
MKCIIDTHVLLWSLFNSSLLSEKASEIILNDKNDIYVSIISFWEISLKYNIGKISLKNVLPDELPQYVKKSGFEILNIDEEIVSTFYKLPKISHSDPFDRLIIWQTIQKNMTLISKDSEFNSYNKYGLKVLW